MEESVLDQLRPLIKGRLTRGALDAVRLIIKPSLASYTIGVAATSGVEIRDQTVRLTYQGGSYFVSVNVFLTRDIHHVARQIIKAHERANKTPT